MGVCDVLIFYFENVTLGEAEMNFAGFVFHCRLFISGKLMIFDGFDNDLITICVMVRFSLVYLINFDTLIETRVGLLSK